MLHPALKGFALVAIRLKGFNFFLFFATILCQSPKTPPVSLYFHRTMGNRCINLLKCPNIYENTAYTHTIEFVQF